MADEMQPYKSFGPPEPLVRPVEMPDGQVVKFKSTDTDEFINSKIEQWYPPVDPEAKDYLNSFYSGFS